MHNRQLIRFGLAAAAGMAGLFAGVPNWSSLRNASLTSQAEARIGRPATPGSIAGVNRRVDRRTARRAYYGTGGYYGTGAAIGTAAAVGAAGAYWGNQAYYGNPYYGNAYFGAYPGQYYGTYPGQYYGASTGQYYGTYPGQFFGTSPGTSTAQMNRPMSSKMYEGPSYYGPYAYATMDQVRAEADAPAKAPAKAQAKAPTQTATIARAADWCASRYKSFNASTGTFLGNDGRRHACP